MRGGPGWVRARSALHHLQDLGHRLRHHLLRDLAESLLLGLELRHQLREHREVRLLHLGAHEVESPVHRLHEPLVRSDDQPVDLFLGRALAHGAASIERRLRPINVIAVVVLAAALPARASPLPSWLEMSGRLYGLAIVDTGGGPRQRPEAIGTLEMQARPVRSLRGVLELRGRVGGPFEGGPGPAVYNFGQTFQNYSPALEFRQAFLEWRASRAEVRAGIQTLAWGKLDGVPPTDVVNPRDWHDPLVVDEFFEEQKIGIPALLGSYSLPDAPGLDLAGVRVALAWLPFAVPPRLPLLLERWFPPSIATGSRPCVSAIGRVGAPPCSGMEFPLAIDLSTRNDVPPRTLASGGIAARVSGSWHRADFDLYHYTGPETAPDVSLSAVAFNATPPPPGMPVDPASVHLRAIAELTQANHTMHMTGADAAFPVGDFTVRAEAAWFVDHSYLRLTQDVLADVRVSAARRAKILAGSHQDVPLGALFPSLDSVEWGIGADTLWRGFHPLLQLNQITILGSAPRLLIANPETRIATTLSRRFLDDRLELEVRGLWEIERGSLYAFPRVSYQLRDDLWLRVGYLVLTGTRNSVLGQFRANDEVVFQARMTF